MRDITLHLGALASYRQIRGLILATGWQDASAPGVFLRSAKRLAAQNAQSIECAAVRRFLVICPLMTIGRFVAHRFRKGNFGGAG